VSTKHPVNPPLNAVPAPLQRTLALAFWAWLVGALVIAGLACMFGAAPGETAGAAALALAPAFLGFILLTRLGETWANTVFLSGWTLGAIGIVAGSGGASSPSLTLFAVPLAFSHLLHARWPATMAAAAIVGVAVAEALWLVAPPMQLGPWPQLIAAFALLYAGAVIALRPPEQPVGQILTEGAALARIDRTGRLIAITGEGARKLGIAPASLSLFEALWDRLSVDEQKALEGAVTSAANGTTGFAVVRLGERTLELEALPSQGTVLLDIRDVTIWARRARQSAARIAEVSHELRTPLTHILGFADMMQSQIFGPLETKYLEYTGLIRQAGENLLGLIGGLLDLSKIEAGRYELDLETFDARAIAREVLRLSEGSAIPRDINLVDELPAEELSVRADPRALRQILTNLVGNAIKFTPDGGEVALGGRSEGDRLVLEVRDNGPGITEEDRARLGRPFERGVGSANVQGTGLGLALVRGLTRLHGGDLSFHDAPGGGALVRVEMPVALVV
jgi:cell cycle sensor histidine kinase DivJ